MRLFFYGTLRDAEVRAAVLGPAAARIAVSDAVAPGWRAVYGPGRSYPFLVPARGYAAPGLIADRVTAPLLARLKAFEGAEYRIGPVTVRSMDGHCRVAAFLPRIALGRRQPEFDLTVWQDREKPRFLAELPGAAQRPA